MNFLIYHTNGLPWIASGQPPPSLLREAKWDRVPPTIFTHKSHTAWLECSNCRLEIFKIRVLKLPKEQEEKILGGNMARLLSKYQGGAV